MAFFEQRLPERFAFGARGGPMWSTEVVKTVGGQRFANANWSMPLHLYDVSQGIKTQEDFDIIRAFHYNVGGRRDGFRFKDWSDYKAVAQPTSLIVTDTYQLLKRYTSGSRTFDRAIYKPVTVVVTRTPLIGSAVVISPTVDLNTGQIAVTGHTTGDVYTWSGEFDVPVAFVQDQLEAVIENKNQHDGFLISWPSVQVEETREL